MELHKDMPDRSTVQFTTSNKTNRIVNDVIDDKNVVTKIMSKSTDLQHIGFNGFAIRHWLTGYYPVAGGLCLGLF